MNSGGTSVVVSGIGSISPAGSSRREAILSYQSGVSKAICKTFESGNSQLVTPLSERAEEVIERLESQAVPLSKVDRTVKLAVFASREALRESGWIDATELGVSIGSSRGATSLLECYHREFSENRSGRLPTGASPLTTLGNISSWVAADIGSNGLSVSHSVTCSTGLHSIVNGVAWMKAGFCSKVLVGAAEAALTDFTLAQFRGLRICAEPNEESYPCRPFNGAENSLVLGEGAAVLALEIEESRALSPGTLVIEGIGVGSEVPHSPTGISEEGTAFRISMKNALQSAASLEPIDVIIGHAPGTKRGDLAELSAISSVFGSDIPFPTSNKWCVGHSFAASGLLSLQYADLLLAGEVDPTVPYPLQLPSYLTVKERPARPRRVMVNAAGFGGNAVSIILSHAP